MGKRTVNPKDQAAQGKPQVSRMPTGGVIHTAAAIQYGAEKYGPFNWRDIPVEALTYTDAVYRHLLKWIDGEDCDAESGLHHLGHAAATLMVLLDAMECGTLIDNRPTVGRASELLKAQQRTAEGHR